MDAPIVRFEGFEFSQGQRRLVRDGRTIRIGSRAFDILATLIDNAGLIVTKDQLMVAVWPNTFVDENNLRVHMSALRRTLDDASGGATIIENIPGRGYCFLAPIVVTDKSATQPIGSTVPAADAPNRPLGRDDVIALLVDQLKKSRPDLSAEELISAVSEGGLVDQALLSGRTTPDTTGLDAEEGLRNRRALVALLTII